MATTPTVRLPYLDNLKAFLILLVILGHCVQNLIEDFDHNIVFRIIYSFHMPLFMAVSGFVCYKPELRWSTLRRRFFQLIVPFVAWGVFSTAVHGQIETIGRIFLHPDNGLWFLWVLFFITAISIACDKLAHALKISGELVNAVVSMGLMGCMAMCNFRLFGFQFIAWYYAFYAMGFYMRKYFAVLERMKLGGALGLFAVFVIMSLFYMRKDPPTFMPVESHVIFNIAYKFATAFVVVMAFIPLFKYLGNTRFAFLSHLGGGTLGLYAIHPVLMQEVIGFVGLEALAAFGGWSVVAMFFGVTLLSLAVYWLLSRTKITAKIFLGK